MILKLFVIHRNPKRFTDATIHLQLLLVNPHPYHNWRNSNARERDRIFVCCGWLPCWCLNICHHRRKHRFVCRKFLWQLLIWTGHDNGTQIFPSHRFNDIKHERRQGRVSEPDGWCETVHGVSQSWRGIRSQSEFYDAKSYQFYVSPYRLIAFCVVKMRDRNLLVESVILICQWNWKIVILN